MNIKELKKSITDASKQVWKITLETETEWRFTNVDLHASDDENYGGCLEIRYMPGAKAVSVWTSNDLLVDVVDLTELKRRLKITNFYADMAQSITAHNPDVAKLITPTHTRAMVEACLAFGEKTPAFSGNEDGIALWIGEGYLVEYKEELESYLIWYQGEYWAASTATGLVEAYTDALAWVKELDDSY